MFVFLPQVLEMDWCAGWGHIWASDWRFVIPVLYYLLLLYSPNIFNIQLAFVTLKNQKVYSSVICFANITHSLSLITSHELASYDIWFAPLHFASCFHPLFLAPCSYQLLLWLNFLLIQSLLIDGGLFIYK